MELDQLGVCMTALVDSIPKFGSKNRSITKKFSVSNGEIRKVLEKLNTSPAKRVASDFDRDVRTIYKIRDNYALINGELYRRIDDGNN